MPQPNTNKQTLHLINSGMNGATMWSTQTLWQMTSDRLPREAKVISRPPAAGPPSEQVHRACSGGLGWTSDRLTREAKSTGKQRHLAPTMLSTQPSRCIVPARSMILILPRLTCRRCCGQARSLASCRRFVCRCRGQARSLASCSRCVMRPGAWPGQL